MSTYGDFVAGRTQIQHLDGLVIGFEARINSEDSFLFALNGDGRVKVATVRSDRVYFNRPGRVWEDAAAVPNEAVFVGNYAKEMF